MIADMHTPAEPDETPAPPGLAAALRAVPLFSTLSDEWLRWLAHRGTEVRFPIAQVIAEQGAPADAFYVILEGLTSWSRRVGGRETHVVTLGPGAVFAEQILILDEPYPTTGRSLTEVRLFRLDPEAFWELIGAVPAVLREVVRTAADRSRLHARMSERLLADASDVLHSSLDYEKTLWAVACMAVERVADFCLVDVVGADGRLRTVAAEHADPAERERIRTVAVLGADATGGVCPLATDEASRLEWTAEVDDAWLESRLASPEEAARLRMLEPRSVIVAPMVARGAVLGTLILARSRADRRFGADDAALAGELARRAAMAVDNARLYAEAQRAIRARDDILGIVSHDLRNPVGTAEMAAGLLLEQTGGGDDRRTTRKYLEMIQRSMGRAQRLINDLLDVTQIDAGKLAVEPGPERPAALVEDTHDAFAAAAAGAGLVLEWEADDDLPWVEADRARVVQALGNLVGNAVKFTPTGGRIVIGARRHAAGVCFEVADTGPGIPPEQLPRLFDRFWKAQGSDRRGAGLGLAIVQGIVAAHGSKVEVESHVGEGTTFRFVLPAAETPGRGSRRER